MAPAAADQPSADSVVPDFLECPICLDVYDRPTTADCGHTFCRACLLKAGAATAAAAPALCPVCRSPLGAGGGINYALQRAIDERPALVARLAERRLLSVDDEQAPAADDSIAGQRNRGIAWRTQRVLLPSSDLYRADVCPIFSLSEAGLSAPILPFDPNPIIRNADEMRRFPAGVFIVRPFVGSAVGVHVESVEHVPPGYSEVAFYELFARRRVFLRADDGPRQPINDVDVDFAQPVVLANLTLQVILGLTSSELRVPHDDLPSLVSAAVELVTTESSAPSLLGPPPLITTDVAGQNLEELEKFSFKVAALLALPRALNQHLIESVFNPSERLALILKYYEQPAEIRKMHTTQLLWRQSSIFNFVVFLVIVIAIILRSHQRLSN